MSKMLRRNWLLVSVTVAVLIQATLIPEIFHAKNLPNLAFAMTVVVALVKGKRAGVAVAFFCGLFQDVLMGQFLGMNIGIFVGVACIVGHLENILFKENIVTPFITVFVSSIVYNVASLLVVYALGVRMGITFGTFLGMFVVSIVNAVVASLVYTWGYLKRDSRRYQDSIYM